MRIPLNFKENVSRSVRNLSLEKRTTFNAGVIIPILFKKMYPGDRFDVEYSTLLQSNPLVAPLMGQYVLQVNSFFEPDSNLYGWMDNNAKLLASEIINKKRHTIGASYLPVYEDSDDANDFSDAVVRFNSRGSILDYIGIPNTAFFHSDDVGDYYSYSICADRLLAYLDIIRTYYMPSQTSSVIYTRENNNPDAQLGSINRDELDRLFKFLRNQDDGITLSDEPWTNVSSHDMSGIGYYLQDICKGGLFCSPYLPDMMRNLLIKVESSKIYVDVENNSFSIDALRFQNKLQRLVERYDISGGRFSSWLKTVWGVRGGKTLDIPQLISATSLIIDPSNITSTSNTYTDTAGSEMGSEIGQLAGNINQSNFKGKNRNKDFSCYVSTNEPGTFVVCVSLIPKVDYSQGVEPDLINCMFADDYKPQFAQLGFQDVPRSLYSVVPSVSVPSSEGGGNYNAENNPIHDVVGKQIAWMDLMSSVNRVHGEFADGGYYDTWVLRRRFSHITQWKGDTRDIPIESTYTAPSYYVDPRDYTYMFANTSYLDDNFFFQIAFNIRAVRPIGKRFMPTLE